MRKHEDSQCKCEHCTIFGTELYLKWLQVVVVVAVACVVAVLQGLSSMNQKYEIGSVASGVSGKTQVTSKQVTQK